MTLNSIKQIYDFKIVFKKNKNEGHKIAYDFNIKNKKKKL